MDQLVSVFNAVVAFVKSDSFKAIVDSLTKIVKSIDVNQIVAIVKKLVEVVGTLAK
ncbi:MAG: hypothetical protein IJU96_09915 [Clostridia bacterium]|nr:hypothetical protein [Clostridia bacterium]